MYAAEFADTDIIFMVSEIAQSLSILPCNSVVCIALAHKGHK